MYYSLDVSALRNTSPLLPHFLEQQADSVEGHFAITSSNIPTYRKDSYLHLPHRLLQQTLSCPRLAEETLNKPKIPTQTWLVLLVYPRREVRDLLLEVQSAHESSEDGTPHLTPARHAQKTTHLNHATVELRGMVDQVKMQSVMRTNHTIVMMHRKMKIPFKT